MIKIILVLSVAFTFPASADDAFLKSIFNGPGPTVEMGHSSTARTHARPTPTTISSALGETSAPFDPNRYNDVPADQYEQLYADPGFQAWYLEGLDNPPIPDGMTTEQFVTFTENGCDGQVPCGAFTGPDNPE